MRHSQYLEAYLDGNARRIADGDLPITIGSFLNQQLRGRAKSYGVKYGQALKRSCIAVGAVEVPTKGGSIGFLAANVAIELMRNLEKRHMSDWKPAELAIYNKLSGQNDSEPKAHFHTCQQCDRVVGGECYCKEGNTTNVWCSARCKAAYDL